MSEKRFVFWVGEGSVEEFEDEEYAEQAVLGAASHGESGALIDEDEAERLKLYGSSSTGA